MSYIITQAESQRDVLMPCGESVRPIGRTLAVLILAALAAGVLRAPLQVSAQQEHHEGCVGWQVISYTQDWIVAPSGLLIEYYVTFSPWRRL